MLEVIAIDFVLLNFYSQLGGTAQCPQHRIKLGMPVHAYNLSTWEAEAEVSYFKVILVCLGSLKPFGMHGTCLKNKFLNAKGIS